jgi:nitroimidazol reductase NimA-like FMN-containing flavoprotein (pyridoxamine 5'-phosphate oxidase superfamily)
MADHTDNRIEALSADECMQLLRRGSYVGRIGFILDGRPMILPVNYLAEERSLVFASLDGTKLHALAGGADVVFEVDEARPPYHAGWSVLVRGRAHEVTDERAVELLRRGPLKSWAAVRDAHWIRVSIDEISGRRIPER